MRPRDEIEAVLRSWDAHERARGATPVIDFDFAPTDVTPEPAGSRLEVFDRLTTLREAVKSTAEPALASRLDADLTYLRAILGERMPLAEYVALTQGCSTTGWSEEYITGVGSAARDSLESLGIGWDASTVDRWEKLEGPISPDDAAAAIRSAATAYEAQVRSLVDTSAPFTLSIESVDVDAYWAYWLDGAGSNSRLRLNLRQARFTEVLARQFALHEVLGHALQGASLSHQAATRDVPWVRLLSVFAPQQVAFEGLAQAIPLYVAPDDKELTARVRVAHYQQLVRAELHLAINAGTPIAECAAHARMRVPFWGDDTIGDALSDRGANPLLRSYLWAYPAGIDWFVALADHDARLGQTVLRAAYQDPLTPRDLQALWPTGPAIEAVGDVVDASR